MRYVCPIHFLSGKELNGGFRIEFVEDLGRDRENNIIFGYPLVSKHVALNSSLAVRLTPGADTPMEGAKLVAAYRDWAQGGRAVYHSAEVRQSGAVVIALPGATSRLGWRNVHLVFVSAAKQISREVVAILVRTISPKKRALLIGATYEYPIQLLEGTEVDALRMEAVTRHAFGFGIVNKLTGAAASTRAILDLLQEVSVWCVVSLAMRATIASNLRI